MTEVTAVTTPTDPVIEIEHALVQLRRSISRRTLHRRAGGGSIVTEAVVPVLDALEDIDHLSVSGVAEALGVDQPRASRLVARAVGEGYVSRVAHPLDGRRQRLELTPKGRRILALIHRHRREAVAAALHDFTEPEAQALARLLARFLGNWTHPR